jgi:hypothetical protein
MGFPILRDKPTSTDQIPNNRDMLGALLWGRSVHRASKPASPDNGAKMPRKPLTRIATPESLNQINPALLARLLSPHAGFLSAHHIDVGSLMQQEQINALSEVLLNPRPDAPDTLIDALIHVEEMADEDGMHKLIELLADAGISHGLDATATPADVAVLTWLEWRDIIHRAHVEHRVLQVQSFGIFMRQPDKSAERPYDIEACIDSLEADLRQHHAAKLRGGACTLFHFLHDDELTIAIRRGGPFRREGCFENGEPSTVQYQPIKYECIVVDLAAWELKMTRTGKRDGEAYRKAVGSRLAGDPEFFTDRQRKFALDPIRRDGRECLACSDIDGIKAVRLVEVELEYADAMSSRDVKRSEDLFLSMDLQRYDFPPDTRIVRARLAFTFADAPKKPRFIEVSTSNRQRCARPSDLPIVNEFLCKRGFMVEAGNVAVAIA